MEEGCIAALHSDLSQGQYKGNSQDNENIDIEH
jgi:hypothetical protein